MYFTLLSAVVLVVRGLPTPTKYPLCHHADVPDTPDMDIYDIFGKYYHVSKNKEKYDANFCQTRNLVTPLILTSDDYFGHIQLMGKLLYFERF